MATTVNDRDLFLSGETRTFPGVIPSDFEFTGNVTGTLNGLPVQEVIDAAYTQGGSGDITADVLSNSATSILMTSSALFKTTTGNGGVFIGGGGLFGKNTGGVTTFAIDGATGNVMITGTLSATSVIGSTSASAVEQGAAIGAILPSATGQITLGSAGKLRTGSGTSRVEFGSTGIFGYSGGVQTFGLSSNGAFSLTGGSVGGSVDIAGTLASVIGPGAANGATLTSGSGSIILGSSDKIKSGSGVAGVFFGSNGFFGRNSNGVTTFGISSSSGAATFLGTITGGSNIDITGLGRFKGVTSSSDGTAAIVANESYGATNGVIGYATSGSGITGIATTGAGILGFATSASGEAISGTNTATGGTALSLSAPISGTAISVVSGSCLLRSVSVLSGGLSVSSGTLSCGTFSTSSSSLVSNLNADMVDGNHSTAFCRTIGSHSGTATISSSNFNILTTVSGVTTSGGGSNITIAPSSDERLKQNIAPEPLGLDFVSALNPVEYRLKANPTMKYHGFIAQDVAPLISATDDCLYQTNPDGMLGVDYVGLIAPMVNAIKELKARVEFLEGQIA